MAKSHGKVFLTIQAHGKRLKHPNSIRLSANNKFQWTHILSLPSMTEEKSLNFLEEIIETDPELEAAENLQVKQYLMSLQGKTPWSRIS